MAINILAQGHWDWYDSYGLIAGQLARRLTALGQHVNAVRLPTMRILNLPCDVARIVEHPRQETQGGIFLGFPTSYARYDDLAHQRPRIAVTMFESTKLPQGWAEVLNDMDAVIVPSEFCRSVFRSSGITAPLYVIPLGVGELYSYRVREENRPLTFLAFLDRGQRKGGIVAQQAFVRAFGDDPNYRLVLKSRKSKVTWGFSNPNIDLLACDMSEAELVSLYGECDVLIAANKGEGFGLLPREASATGCIALATNWGGTADDLDQWGWPLPYTLEKVECQGQEEFAGQDLGEWAKCTPDEIAEVLCYVAANRAEYQAQVPQKAAAARQLYSWEGFAEAVLAVWQEIGEIQAHCKVVG